MVFPIGTTHQLPSARLPKSQNMLWCFYHNRIDVTFKLVLRHVWLMASNRKRPNKHVNCIFFYQSRPPTPPPRIAGTYWIYCIILLKKTFPLLNRVPTTMSLKTFPTVDSTQKSVRFLPWSTCFQIFRRQSVFHEWLPSNKMKSELHCT